jgi:AraC-like DNA-binding protein
MPMLPVSAFVALVLAYLSLRALLAGGRGLLAVFLAACALQSLAVALAAGYGITTLHPLLPVTATAIPPLAWITFRAAQFRRVSVTTDWPHLAAPLFCLFCRMFAPDTVDVIVALIFLGYGGAILLHLQQTKDLPLARIESGGRPVLVWQTLGGLLIASAVSDVLIALAYASGNADWAGWIISLFASVILLLLGALSSLPEAVGEDEAPEAALTPQDSDPGAETLTEDREILIRLDNFLAREKPYLDPGLTLQRLARRLQLPEKRLSAAINRATGGNVSRHINRWRIDHACGLIAAGKNVTDAMLDSGFNTKSNFNREFLRVTQVSPSTWMKHRQNRDETAEDLADTGGARTDEKRQTAH